MGISLPPTLDTKNLRATRLGSFPGHAASMPRMPTIPSFPCDCPTPTYHTSVRVGDGFILPQLPPLGRRKESETELQ